MISVYIQCALKVTYFKHFFKMCSLYAVEELLTDEEKVCCEAEQDNARDTGVNR